jgi:enediyne polyketide synthase
VAACLPEAELKVRIERSPEQQRRRSASIDMDHRPDGKLDPKNSRFRSATYDGAWKLAVDSAIPVGCDLQSISHRPANEWELMLGADGLSLAETVASMAKEPLDVAALRVWTVRESMKKAGHAAGAPLTLVPEFSAHWLEFKSGDLRAFSSLMTPSGEHAKVCVTVALRSVTSEALYQ